MSMLAMALRQGTSFSNLPRESGTAKAKSKARSLYWQRLDSENKHTRDQIAITLGIVDQDPTCEYNVKI